jgi:TM2 domain-containing membrane protein YozV
MSESNCTKIRRSPVGPLLALALLLPGCIRMTPEQGRVYYHWLEDDRPEIQPPPVRKHKALAAVIGLVFPGLGHVYLEEYGWAVGYFFISLACGGIIFSAVAAAIDTDEVNRAFVADAYEPIMNEKRQEERWGSDVAPVASAAPAPATAPAPQARRSGVRSR